MGMWLAPGTGMTSTAHVVTRIHGSLTAPSVGAIARGGHPLTFLTTPIVFALAIPLALLDACVTVYQWVCFPVYGIERVRRARYFTLDRHRLPYLTALERVNCTHCSYANGVLAYTREVSARTETYWCPIKHARPVRDPHGRYHAFAEYGDAAGYRRHSSTLRRALSAPAKHSALAMPAEPSAGER
jgi:hypothetical protein